MSEVSSGDRVKFHYVGTLDDGSEFDSSLEREPLEVTVGQGEIIPGVEHALIGMTPGDTKTVRIEADDAYGAHDAEKVIQVERDQIPEDVELETGRMLELRGTDGSRSIVTIAEVSDDTVALDANHPLAGQNLTFQLQLVEVGA